MRKKAETIKWNDEVKATFLKEVDKLERTHPQSPDYSVQLNYLQTMLSLPWGIYTTDNLSLVNAEKTLNKDHYGLEKVKERILEHLAVLKLKGDMKSPIICLYASGCGKNPLVDRIVTGYPRSDADNLNQENGYIDKVLNTGEIFGFWVIEGPQSIKEEFLVMRQIFRF